MNETKPIPASSGLYIVTLKNEEPISVNAQDPRMAEKAIRVTRNNCKFGKAKNLRGRRKNYFKTFGEHNVNFSPIALVDDIAMAETVVLAALDEYRIQGASGRKNEWLEGIDPQVVLSIAFAELDRVNLAYQPLEEDSGVRAINLKPSELQRPRGSSRREKKFGSLYRIARKPRKLKSHNEVTWRKLERVIEENGGKADFDSLADAAQGHFHFGEENSNPRKFVVYCITSGWLEQTN